jgi:hypothetical protein
MREAETNSPSIQTSSPGQLEAVVRGKSALDKVDLRKKPTIRPHRAPHMMLAKRYELKYRVSESMARRIKGYISAFLSPDPYTRRWPDGQYSICSIYLDSTRFDLFHETELDKCNRFKLRIRGYDDEPNSPVFFEIKRKLNGIIYKSRAKAGKDQIADILKGHFLPPQATETDRTTLRQFVHYTHCLRARPIVLIRYKREAYEGKIDTQVRVTFDRQLGYLSTDAPVFKMSGYGWKKIPIDFVVLEIKFTDLFPAWLVDMVRMLNLNRESMSKYGNSVEQMAPSGLLIPALL